MLVSRFSNNVTRLITGHSAPNQTIRYGGHSFGNLQSFSGSRQLVRQISFPVTTANQPARNFWNLRANNGGYDQKRYNDLVKHFATVKNQAEKWQLAHQALLNVLPSQRSRTPKRTQAIKNITPRTGRVDKTARNWTAEIQSLQDRANRLNQHPSPGNNTEKTNNNIEDKIKEKKEFFDKNFPEHVSQETALNYRKNLDNSLARASSPKHQLQILDNYIHAVSSLPTPKQELQDRFDQIERERSRITPEQKELQKRFERIERERIRG